MLKPRDAYMANGWYLDIPIPGIGADAIFETLEGVGKSGGTVSIVDAGTNRKIKFSDQLVEFSEMTLTRTMQGTTADFALEALVETMITTGVKLPVVATKLHHGKEVFKIIFEGFAFHSQSEPPQNIESTEKYTISYTASCDGYEKIPTGQ